MKRYVTPSSACRSASRLRIAAWTETSSAEVGSSQTTTRGLPAKARAIATRCLRPPESCRACGEQALVEAHRARRLLQPLARARCPRDPDELRERATDDPAHRETAVERRVRVLEDDLKRAHLFRARACTMRGASGFPSSSTASPSSGDVRPRSTRASVVLPLPDSPTSPRVSPGRIANVDVRRARARRGPLAGTSCSRARGRRPPAPFGCAADAWPAAAGLREVCACSWKWQRLECPSSDPVERRLVRVTDVAARGCTAPAKTQPGKVGARAAGGSRGSCRAGPGPCAGRRVGCTGAGRRCMDAAGRAKTCRAGPSSTSRPA